MTDDAIDDQRATFQNAYAQVQMSVASGQAEGQLLIGRPGKVADHAEFSNALIGFHRDIAEEAHAAFPQEGRLKSSALASA